MDTTVIQTQDLTKKYKTFVAVDHLNLEVQAGEVFGLLGPNGAGKTTTILMLLGLTEPTSGKVRVLGLDPARQPLSVKSRVGYMPDQIGFYDEMTARENLNYVARLNGIPGSEIPRRTSEALARVGMEKMADKRVGTFSRGMRQRLGVADVLIKQPRLIIMDEPTSGLDPEASHEFLAMILTLKQEGISILLSSHQLYQVQAVCDRVGLFNQGKMVLEGAVDELALQVLGGAYHIQLEARGASSEIVNALENVPGLTNIRTLSSQRYAMEAVRDLRPEAAQAVVDAGGRLYRLDVQAQSLDDIYATFFKEVEHGTVDHVATAD
ncbi:MAG: ABC transporter ATP-binding protein [Chloroflexi bacterium]|nr:ABC transporter ATP-binding protein [Anaerolineaceae bacterium]NMB90223.1 ABC transporter ATP-binding protein [Chloroflexota bacterium]